MGGVRPRSKFVMKTKNRRCPKCGAAVNNQRTRCKKCAKVLSKPKKRGAGGSW
jgi:predicted nucleic acid-binding Zn ribbon protein